jgi:photosynthetic reaction center cytochrome c subunit
MKLIFKLVLCVWAAVMLTGCERPPIETVQTGFRGTGMEQIYNPRILAKQASLNQAPEAPDAASADGPKASQTPVPRNIVLVQILR